MQYSSQGAILSRCGNYRYSLTRSWSKGHPNKAVFIGLNPSTADHKEDDPTIRRCVAFAKSWGCNSLEMVNLFAYRATKPEEMIRAADPIGPDNDLNISKALNEATFIIASWGNHGIHKGRSAVIRDRYLNLLSCLGINATGEPKHPLYLRASLKPIPYSTQP